MNVKKEIESTEMKLVWAQMKYCPYWPARVVDTPPVMGRAPVHKACVLFFGTKEFGFVDLDKMVDYHLNREKFIKKGRGVPFKNAVKQIDEFILDPKKFKSNAFAKPVGKKIVIKTELDIEQRLGIKQETGSNNDSYQQRTVSTNSAEEKQKLLKAFASLKTENQKITFALKKKEEDCVKLLSDMEALKKENVSTMAIVSELKKKITENEQKNSELVHQNRILSARTKQLQTGITKQDNPNENCFEENKNDIYEVDKLIDDKIIGNVRHFRVRWKGYKPSDDTWERESNLKCATILKKYLQSKAKY